MYHPIIKDEHGVELIYIDGGGVYLFPTEANQCDSCKEGITLIPLDERGEDARFHGSKNITWSHAREDYTWPCARLEPEAFAKATAEWNALSEKEKEELYG